jgi:hypothetical protein
MATLAAGVERWVLGGVYDLVTAMTRGAAFVASQLDDRLLGAGIDAIADRSARLDAKMRAALAALSVAAIGIILYLALRRTP